MAAGGSAVYLGEGEAGWVTPGPERSALVLGPPRSGKTTSIVIPSVVAAPGAVVSTSTKTDVVDASLDARRRSGRCWLYDPSSSEELRGTTRLRWSPVSGAGTWDDAVLSARTLVTTAHAVRGRHEASHWTERAEALLAPLLHAAALERQGMEAVVRAVNRREAAPALRSLERHGSDVGADLLAGVASTDERELYGIWSTASGALGAYRTSSALESSSCPNFDPSSFVDSTDTVYVCAPATSQELLAPIVVSLIEAIRNAAYRLRRSWPPLLLALDELANIAPLPSLPAIVAEGGGQGVVTLGCLQDLSQARARWGDQSSGFLSLFSATVVLPGIADMGTLQAVSALAGDGEVETRSRTRARWSGRSSSVTAVPQRRPRLPVDAVARGIAGHALVVDPAATPRWCRLTPWFRTSPWREAVSGSAAPGARR